MDDPAFLRFSCFCWTHVSFPICKFIFKCRNNVWSKCVVLVVESGPFLWFLVVQLHHYYCHFQVIYHSTQRLGHLTHLHLRTSGTFLKHTSQNTFFWRCSQSCPLPSPITPSLLFLHSLIYYSSMWTTRWLYKTVGKQKGIWRRERGTSQDPYRIWGEQPC